MPYRHVPVIALALAAAACSRDEPAAPPRAAAAEASTAAATPAPSAPRAPVKPPAASSRETPALRVATLDGTPYDLAQHRGKWVVVNFWATWCAPCLKEMPELSALHTMRDDVEVVGLAYEEIDAADMRAFLARRPVTYPIAIIDTYDPPADFETPRGLPMTVLVAPDGRVAKQVTGPVTAKSIEDAIAAHAAKG